MFEIDRGQLLTYVAVAAAVLAVGFVSLKKSGGGSVESGAGTAASSNPSDHEGGPAFRAGGGSRRLVVDVSGAVARPGVYRLTDGSRVIDAIRKAGGPSGRAMTSGINRAARVADGQQIVVPERPLAPVGGSSPAGPAPAAGGGTDGPISLGTATTEQLEEIDGIGPVTAQKIIEFRDSKGGLGSVEDLDEVSGIGPVTMESLRSALQP